MSDLGHVKIDRQIEDWKFWDSLPMVGFWMHLIIKASWKDRSWKRGIEIQRGEMVTSLRNLADECGSSVNTVKKYIRILEDEGQITVKKAGNAGMKIAIVNYSLYQGVYQALYQNVNTDRYTDRYTLPINKKERKERREEENNDPRFSDFWNLYPKKIGQQKADAEWQAIVNLGEATPAEIINGLQRVRDLQWDRWPESEQRYIPAPARWLQEHRWTDEPEAYVPRETKKAKPEPSYMKELEEMEKRKKEEEELPF